ncbi:MAG: hypothetical protein EXS39_07920 [Opitutaceae bacterium]|nr:hypothetical protein [Opitutaceae bacterium]
MKNVGRRQFVKDVAKGSLLLSTTALGASMLKAQEGAAARSSAPAITGSTQETVLLALDPAAFPSMEGARQVLEPARKHPANPVLRPRPGQWDGTRCKVYGTVLYDPQDRQFKMWYSGGTDTPDAVRRRDGAARHVGYACSEDGVNWERPNLGLVEFEGSRDNNLLLLNAQAPSVFLQPHEPDPARRYVMVTEEGLSTSYNKVLYSADGLHWVPVAGEPMASRPGGRHHEPFSILFDPEEPDPKRRWKGYSLLHVHDHGYRGRSVGLFMGTGPEHWVEYPTQPIMSSVDGMESEIHIPHVTRFRDLYIMLFDAMEPNHHTQTEIAISRDGIQFERIQNGVKLIPNGKPGEPDAGKVCVSPRSMFVHEGKIWWYYTMSPDTYQTGPRGLRATPWYRYTGLAQWRQDGFASLRLAPGATGATITTRRLKLNGQVPLKAWLNAETSLSGPGIGVELLDAAGKVLASAKPWTGDHLRAEIQWHGVPPVLSAGQEVFLRLRFDGLTTRVFAVGTPGATLAGPTPSAAVAPTRPAVRKDPREIWRFAAGAKISASPALHEGGLFFGSWDQQLYALEARTGQVRWKHATGNAITTTPACHATTVYGASRDGHIYALDAATGESRWKSAASTGRIAVSPNGGWVDSSPTIGAYNCGPKRDSPPPMRLFVGCHNRDLHAFDVDLSRDAAWFAPASPGEGTEVWRFPTFNWILSRPAVAGYRVYFGSVDGRLYAVDARCGALVWSYTAGRHLRYSPQVVPGSVVCEAVCGSPLVVDDTVYCGADDGFLYALDASTGAEKWVFQTEKWIWGRPLWTANILIVASADGRVYGVDASSGKRLWVRATGNANYADVVALGPLALVACTNGRLYALDAATGEIAWTFEADAGLRAAPAVDAQGIIYLPTCAGTIFALQGH